MLRGRYYRILWFFVGVVSQIVWWDILMPRVIGRRLASRGRMARYQRLAVRFHALAVRLGGVMIKAGQFLSARLDVLPSVVTDELAGLQDEVDAEDFATVRAVIEREFGAALESHFEAFDPAPLASASIGQVHVAQVRQGNDPAAVVVKVQRPNIEAIVETDLAALRVVGRWINAYGVIRRRADIPALLEEFGCTLHEEMDYLHEGKNAEIFAANFAGDERVRVPAVFWAHTTRRVLTLENIPAIKITDYARITAAGVERVEVASRLFDVYMKQFFVDGFFHADPHPGNLFVLPEGSPAADSPRAWKLVFVDFGMAGTIPAHLLDALRELFIAVGTKDGARMIRAYQSMGALLPGADLDLLERATQMAFERYWGKATQEMLQISPAEVMEMMHEFRGLIFEMPFQVPENMILLGRALATLVGICSGLDADFNIWQAVAPYAQRLVSRSVTEQLEPLLKEAGSSLLSALLLPGKLDRLANRMEQGRLETRAPRVEELLQRVERGQRRLGLTVLFGAFFLGAVLLYGNGNMALAGISAALALGTVVRMAR